MAVSFNSVGTWAEYTTDLQTVTLPGSLAAGIRMFLFVAWKDYAITLAQPSGWTPIVNSYADGTANSGNGTGSMSQAVFYRDWVSGDTAPQLDFSTTTNLLAEAVIITFAKEASDTWGTPLYATAPHSWTTSPVTTSATSGTTVVRSGAVVACQSATRDDSATMTRPTTGIDVASGITWNGNYVESPATHYSTTTGNDHSGDLGYRLVTTGGTVTLRATCDAQSAADSGSLVWVVQPANNDQTATPSTLALTISTFAPTVTATVNQLVTPSTASLTATAFAPTAQAPRLATPTTASLSLTPFAPSVATPQLCTPGTVSLTLTSFAPSVIAPQTVTPGVASLTLTTVAPTASAPRTVTPGTLSLSTATFAPTVTASENDPPTGGGWSIGPSVLIGR